MFSICLNFVCAKEDVCLKIVNGFVDNVLAIADWCRSTGLCAYRQQCKARQMIVCFGNLWMVSLKSSENSVLKLKKVHFDLNSDFFQRWSKSIAFYPKWITEMMTHPGGGLCTEKWNTWMNLLASFFSSTRFIPFGNRLLWWIKLSKTMIPNTLVYFLVNSLEFPIKWSELKTKWKQINDEQER